MTTRWYSDEEKAAAVRKVRQVRQELRTKLDTVRRVATQLGYGPESGRSGVKQADIDAGETPGVSTEQSAAS